MGICEKVLFVLFSLELSFPQLPLALKLTYKYLVYKYKAGDMAM